ncbi:MAG: hypothetical protein HYS21_01195 [Deltaproteobacteria bacterium]|nr:hypothetical protein [Deltaproteobacteria bacterium]
MSQPAEKKFPQLFLIGLGLAIIFSLSFLKVYDYDIWFHLKTGEYIVDNLVIPKADVFSYTAAGHEWVTHEWLFEVVAYFVYLAGGAVGLTLFKALSITAVFGIYLVFFYRRGTSAYVLTLVTVIGAILARERFLERPELFTYVFAAIFICLLEKFRTEEKQGGLSERKYLFAMPAIMVVWANAHSGAIFGIIILGAYAFSEFVSAIFKSRNPFKDPKVISVLLISFITFIAGFINPNTYNAYLYPFVALKSMKGAGINVAEFTPPTWQTDYLFFIFLAISSVIILINIKRASIAHLLLFALFSVTSLRFSRNIAFWAIISVPIISLYADELKNRFCKRNINGIIPAVLVAIIVVLSAAPYVYGTMKNGWLGAGVKERWFPEGAVQFINENRIEGNMYNSYEFGGYLIWRTYPQRRVFIDGRNDVYPELMVEQRMLGALGFENIIDKFNINYALFSFTQGNPEYINPDPYFGQGLALVYWDDVAMVFVKRTPENSALIERFEYRAVKPADSQFAFTDLNNADALVSELQRNISANPSGWRNHMLLGNLYGMLGYVDKAKEEINISQVNYRGGR